MKITEAGRKLAEIEDDSKKKAFLFNLSLKIPIISELYQRYGRDIPEEINSITDFLVDVKKLEKREAGRLANLYIKNHTFFGEINKDELKDIEETKDIKLPPLLNPELKIVNEDLITLLKLKYLFNPPSENSKEEILNQVLEKFKDSGDAGIKSLVEGIKHSENEEGKKALINALLSSFEKKYSILKISEKKRRKK